VAIAACTVGTLAETVGDQPARLFIDESLRGVGAVKTTCPDDVVEQVRAHRMNAVCARFDGSFERFEVRWGLQMIQTEGPEDRRTQAGAPAVQPQTDWESNGTIHDRVYLVGNHAVGIRFASGVVLMVW
jgi:hypothetical protein